MKQTGKDANLLTCILARYYFFTELAAEPA